MTIREQFLAHFGFTADAHIVALDERYNDNYGNFFDAYILDGVEVHKVQVSHVSNPFYGVKAHEIITEGDLQALANELYRRKNKDYGEYSDVPYYGCTVVLSRSRKAPNKVPLKVIRFIGAHFNGYHRVDDQIVVEDNDGDQYIVSVGCIKEIVRGLGIPTLDRY